MDIPGRSTNLKKIRRARCGRSSIFFFFSFGSVFISGLIGEIWPIKWELVHLNVWFFLRGPVEDGKGRGMRGITKKRAGFGHDWLAWPYDCVTSLDWGRSFFKRPRFLRVSLSFEKSSWKQIYVSCIMNRKMVHKNLTWFMYKFSHFYLIAFWSEFYIIFFKFFQEKKIEAMNFRLRNTQITASNINCDTNVFSRTLKSGRFYVFIKMIWENSGRFWKKIPLKTRVFLQRWKRRYFKLQGKKLYYAKDFNVRD